MNKGLGNYFGRCPSQLACTEMKDEAGCKGWSDCRWVGASGKKKAGRAKAAKEIAGAEKMPGARGEVMPGAHWNAVTTEELRRQQATSPIKSRPAMNRAVGGCLGGGHRGGRVGAATLSMRGRSIGFRRGTEPNGQSRPAIMPSGPALGALLPRVVRFTSSLSELKPDAIATSVTIYFRWVPPRRGSPGLSAVRAPRAPGHSRLGAEGPGALESTRHPRPAFPGLMRFRAKVPGLRKPVPIFRLTEEPANGVAEASDPSRFSAMRRKPLTP